MVSADKLVQQIQQARVLVIGDIMLDRYWFGDVERISPEAPVPVVLVGDVQSRLGGAGNVAVNVTSLGAQCSLIGVVGDDEAGRSVSELAIEFGAEPHIVTDRSMPTCIKQRIISRNQQLLRADFENRPNEGVHAEILKVAERLIHSHDVVVLSDYGKGTLENIQLLIALALERGKPVLVDPKGADFSRYRGASMITPNLKEFEQVAGAVNDDKDLEVKAKQVIALHDLGALLVTLSERGMKLFEAHSAPIHRKARSQEVFDVSGAGDTVIGTMAMCMATKLNMSQSLKVANNAAGVVVSKIGTATVNPAELRAAIEAEEKV